MSKNLYIMMGLPGAGKSYWLSKYALSDHVISRDEIRFSMLKDGEDYFAHEKEVYDKYVEEIQKALDIEQEEDLYVYADATQISWKSRNRLLSRLNLKDVDVHIVYISTPIPECIYNNASRKGREYVSIATMKEFAQRLQIPEADDFKYRSITTVKYNTTVNTLKRGEN